MDLETLFAKLEKIEAEVTGLKGEVAGLKGDITALGGRVKKLEEAPPLTTRQRAEQAFARGSRASRWARPAENSITGPRGRSRFSI